MILVFILLVRFMLYGLFLVVRVIGECNFLVWFIVVLIELVFVGRRGDGYWEVVI